MTTGKVYSSNSGTAPHRLVELGRKREWFARQLMRHIPGLSEQHATELLAGTARFDQQGRLHAADRRAAVHI